ncbi:MAG: methyl-accepting chemotaxis protein [Thioalkalivibrio sp.]
MQIRSQRIKLTLLVVAVSLLPLVIMAVSTSQVLRGQVEGSLQEALVGIGQEVSNLLETYMLQRGDELGAIAEHAERFDGPGGDGVLAGYRRHFDEFSYLAIVEPSGQVRAETGELILGDAQNRQRQLLGWASAAADGQRLLDVDDQPGADRERYIVFLQPLAGDEGVLVGQVAGSRVVNITNRVQIGETGRATLFNHQGHLIGHPDPSRYGYDMSHYPILDPVLRRGEGHPGGEFLSGDGRMKWGLTFALDDLERRYDVRWGVIVDQTLEELYAPLTRVQRLMWLVSLLVLAGAVILGIAYAHRLVRPLNHLSECLQQAADDADLTRRVRVDSHDEIGRTGEAYNASMERLQGMVRELNGAVGELSTASDQLTQHARISREATDQQRGELNQVASAVDEMVGSVEDVARNTRQAAEGATEARGVAEEGRRTVASSVAATEDLAQGMENASQAVSKVQSGAQNIDTILRVISDVAEQTNLLALNAAIEAARAGEQGRGFAVVADEVRTLARRTNASITEIRSIIESLQSDVGNAVNLMQRSAEQGEQNRQRVADADQALQRIAEAVQRIDDMNQQIAQASNEQATTMEEIRRSVTGINDSAGQSAEEMRGVDDAGRHLSELAQRVGQLVNRFRA